MYRFALIDDEPKDRAMVLNSMQDHYHGIECVAFSSTEQFEEAEQEFDALFLDIDMPDMNGIVFASKWKETYSQTLIIFVSWHEDLIFEGMKLLPFTFVRKSHLDLDMMDCMKNVLKRLHKRDQTWTIQLEHTMRKLLIRDILYFEQMENYCIVYLVTGKNLEFRCSMTKLAQELREYGVFMQIARGYIVNMQHVISCKNKRALLRNNKELEISRRRWTICHEAWVKFQITSR